MGWFHKTLKDMEKAIERKDWQEAKDIADEHMKVFYEDGFTDSLSFASTHLKTYSDSMGNIRGILTSAPKDKKARIPIGHDITLLRVSNEEAYKAIVRFEKIMQKLIKEGKFEE